MIRNKASIGSILDYMANQGLVNVTSDGYKQIREAISAAEASNQILRQFISENYDVDMAEA